jgi:hypothetical protein
VRGVLLAEAAILLKLDPLGIVLLVLERVVVALLAVLTTQRNLISHFCLCPLLYFSVFSALPPILRAGFQEKKHRLSGDVLV